MASQFLISVDLGGTKIIDSQNQKSFQRIRTFRTRQHVKIFKTKLGDDEAFYGGITLAEEFLK
ncbi:MAG: hypothetical protein NTZ27_05830 [Ignavibacteriales bacterium]|nr:hypothetical protein [Ignavibacteriales bacterium]